LWWQVRTPLAWAATIALALGIGTYVGERGRPVQMPSDHATPDRANQLARNAPTLDNLAAPALQKQRESRGRRSSPAIAPAAGTLADETKPPLAQPMAVSKSSADSASYREEAQLDAQRAASAGANSRVAAKAAVSLGERGYVMKGEPIGADSARLLLGRDPLVVPDLSVRGIYRARMIGYSGVVIVEQALDSSTTIDVINGRPAPLQLEAVVVSGAGEMRRDTQSPGARALLGRRADTAPPPPPSPEPVPASPAPAAMEKAGRVASDFFVDVRGPLSTDSLAALKRLLRPLRP